MAKKSDIVKAEAAAIQPVEQIESLILTIRGKQVILDRDLARLYGVETFRLNEQVKRNIERFPEDFMFQLSKEEWKEISSQFSITSVEGKVLRSQIASIKTEGEVLSSQNASFEKHNAQYSPIEVKQFDRAHDRFLCIDDTVYLIGASLKDLGKKRFGFVKLEQPTDELLSKM